MNPKFEPPKSTVIGDLLALAVAGSLLAWVLFGWFTEHLK